MLSWTSGFRNTPHILKSPIKKFELLNKEIEEFVAMSISKGVVEVKMSECQKIYSDSSSVGASDSINITR